LSAFKKKKKFQFLTIKKLKYKSLGKHYVLKIFFTDFNPQTRFDKTIWDIISITRISTKEQNINASKNQII
jgi:hypothetical protein